MTCPKSSSFMLWNPGLSDSWAHAHGRGDFRCWTDHYRLTSYVVNPHLPLEELHCCPVQGHHKTECVWSLLRKTLTTHHFLLIAFLALLSMFNVIYIDCTSMLETLHLYNGVLLQLSPQLHMPGCHARGCHVATAGVGSVNTTDTSKCYKQGFLTPRHKSRCLKLPAHRSTALHYCSFSTLCES